MEKNTRIDYLFSGGGSLGPVTPLLAVIEHLRKKGETRIGFVGTEDGPEQRVIEESDLPFFSLPCGKFRRYWDVRNLTDPVKVIAGVREAVDMLEKLQPGVVVSAGAYVSVPLVIAAAMKRIPVVIHQQDVRPGLANKIMARFARKIFVSLEESVKYFPHKKVQWIGNPVRHKILLGDKNKAAEIFSLDSRLPTVLILGGGTGSLAINDAVHKALPKLLRSMNIIHVAGKGKNVFQDKKLQDIHQGGDVLAEQTENDPRYQHYHVFEILTDDMPHAFAAADIVVSRAGFGTLSELAALAKPSIIIPMPGTHQEDNARYFEAEESIITLHQKTLTHEMLITTLDALLANKEKRARLSQRIHGFYRKDAAPLFAKYLMTLTRS